MAIKFFDCKGFGQIEPSQVWFNRSGMVEAQCRLDPTKFASNFPMTPAEVDAGMLYAEDGAFLMIDKVNKTATVPNEEMSKLGYKMGINYSTERNYNPYTPGRRNFCMICGEFLPRIGFVEPGMRICSNTVAWDTECTLFSDVSEGGPTSESVQVYVKVRDHLREHPEEPIYAYVTDKSNGKLVLGAKVADALGGVYAQIVQAYTNADTTLSFKIMFINKPDEDPTYSD